MRGRWMQRHRFIGVVLGVTLFVLLPAFFVMGATVTAPIRVSFVRSFVLFSTIS